MSLAAAPPHQKRSKCCNNEQKESKGGKRRELEALRCSVHAFLQNLGLGLHAVTPQVVLSRGFKNTRLYLLYR